MRMRMMGVRTLTATVLFLILAKVNVWADTETHLVLAVGYRAFLLCAPAFLLLGLPLAMRASVGLCLAAVAASLLSVNAVTMGLLAVGMAVSGYLAKSVAAHTSQGAADNKVSLNLGSLASGLLLMTSVGQIALLLACAASLVVALLLSLKVDWDAVGIARADAAGEERQMEALPFLGWSLIGIATGIKLTGIFAILPQYLLARVGALPQWFGALIVMNSLIVVFIQHRVMRGLDRAKPGMTFMVSLSAMALLAMPGLMRVERPAFSVAWIVLLTLGECALSRYDRSAQEAGYLFPKELMVGVGSFATVWLARNFAGQIHLSGLLGCACLGMGVGLLTLARNLKGDLLRQAKEVSLCPKPSR